MNNKNANWMLLIVVIFFMFACNGFNEEQKKTEKTWIPQIEGEWWQLTTTYPDISPYEYTKGDNKVCDFTIFQAADSSWQCIACVRGNNYPGKHRFLFRWEANNLTDTLWKQKGIFQATGTDTNKKDGFGYKWDKSLYPEKGKLQAPHCFKDEGKYYLFYNNNHAMCKISNDGLHWKDYQNDAGSYHFFSMGRDIMVFDDRENSGNRIAYYTVGGEYPQFMATKSCRTLTGEWSEAKMIYNGYSNTRHPIYPNEMAESPFVLKYNEKYYLFAQLHVFISDDPLDFTENKKVADLESDLYHERVWAPEIIHNKGKYYIAAYRPNGIWMAELKWIATDKVCEYD